MVRDRVHRLFLTYENTLVPVSLLLSELRALFNRNTFVEPIDSCFDQSWHTRFCAAVQTDYFLLGCWSVIKAGAKQENNPQLLTDFEFLQKEVRNYCQALTGLFKRPFTVASINQHFLENQIEQIRNQLKEARILREEGLSLDVINLCERHRQEIIAVIKKWPIL